MGKLITVIGPSGIGKTTFVKALAKVGKFGLAFEQHSDRPFQALFEQEARFGLANQIDYLLLRAEQERQLRAEPQTGLMDGGLDLDFHGFTRLFHSRGLLSDLEFDLCQRLYNTLRGLLPLPNLIIRLRAAPETIATRLSVRKRINIASASDTAAFETFLDGWLAMVDPINILNVDVSANDRTYVSLLPKLLESIEHQLGKISTAQVL
jgi:deoxyadenosine/deoxycytidine kinase